MTALAARPPIASAAAAAAMTRMGTKGFIVPPWLLGARWAWPSGCSGVRLAASRCGHRPAQCRDEPIHPVPVAAVEAVGQELHDEAHEDGPWETVLHAGAHDLRPLDEAGEDLAH